MNYIKKIWLDLRFLNKDNYYSQFIFQLVLSLTKQSPDYFYNIYLDLTFSNLNFWANTQNTFPLSKAWKLLWQWNFKKKLKKDNNDLIIFFNYKKPSWIKEKYLLFIPELSNLYFPKKQNIVNRYYEKHVFTDSTTNASKIICFNKKTKEEINDKLDISEEKIEVLNPWFSKKTRIISWVNEDFKLNIKTKYNISWDFLIYNAWIWTEKNLDKIISVFKKMRKNKNNINLLILDNNTITDLNFRKQIIKNKLTNKIFFIGWVNEFEKEYFYTNTLWILYPALYNVFPFSLNDALNYKTNILISDLKNIKKILWDNAIYFDPINIDDIYEKIINLTKNTLDYNEIFEKNSIEKSSNKLIKIIDSIDVLD